MGIKFSELPVLEIDELSGEDSFAVLDASEGVLKRANLDIPLSVEHGGTGNEEGYIRTGARNMSSTGANATVEGRFNEARGDASHAEGDGNTAYGFTAHVEGHQNTANGDYSHAEGHETRALGDYSHTEGHGTIAQQSCQTVIGSFNENQSGTLFEIGNGTDNDNRSNALEVYSNGNLNVTGDVLSNGVSIKVVPNPSGTATTALSGLQVGSTIYSVSTGGLPFDPIPVEHGGTGNTAGYIRTGQAAGSSIGNKATAEGNNTTASGEYSHAEGDSCVASGNYSHAEGYSSTASEYSAHAENRYTVASGQFSHAEGEGSTAAGGRAHAEGDHTTASGASSHTEGYQCSITADGKYGHAEGYKSSVTGTGAHAEGYASASGAYSHSEGRESVASGYAGHAEGNSTAAATYSHSEGSGTSANGNYSHVEGQNSSTSSNATGAHAEGIGSTSNGSASHSEGEGSTASGNSSHAEGLGTLASGNYSHSGGVYTKADSASVGSFVHGIGTGTDVLTADKRAMFLTGDLETKKFSDHTLYTTSGPCFAIPGSNVVISPGQTYYAKNGFCGTVTSNTFTSTTAADRKFYIAGFEPGGIYLVFAVLYSYDSTYGYKASENGLGIISCGKNGYIHRSGVYPGGSKTDHAVNYYLLGEGGTDSETTLEITAPTSAYVDPSLQGKVQTAQLRILRIS